MTRSEIMSSESGLCLDQIHRLSCHHYISPSLPVDLPPLQQLPDCLLMQNFPSLLTSRVLNPAPKSCVLDCMRRAGQQVVASVHADAGPGPDRGCVGAA